MIFENSKVYDTLKFIALTVLPAIETLWLTLGNIWHFPYVVEIGATIAAIDVFLGALIGISTKNFYKPIPMDIEGLKYIDADEDEEIEGVEVDERD